MRRGLAGELLQHNRQPAMEADGAILPPAALLETFRGRGRAFGFRDIFGAARGPLSILPASVVFSVTPDPVCREAFALAGRSRPAGPHPEGARCCRHSPRRRNLPAAVGGRIGDAGIAPWPPSSAGLERHRTHQAPVPMKASSTRSDKQAREELARLRRTAPAPVRGENPCPPRFWRRRVASAHLSIRRAPQLIGAAGVNIIQARIIRAQGSGVVAARFVCNGEVVILALALDGSSARQAGRFHMDGQKQRISTTGGPGTSGGPPAGEGGALLRSRWWDRVSRRWGDGPPLRHQDPPARAGRLSAPTRGLIDACTNFRTAAVEIIQRSSDSRF